MTQCARVIDPETLLRRAHETGHTQPRTMTEIESTATQPSLPFIPPILFGGFLVSIAGTGALANCAVLAALLRRSSKNGSLTIVRQLSFVDLIICATIVPELWSKNYKTWMFGITGCTFYQGTIVLASTASLYLIATMALHSLATINLEINIAKRKEERKRSDDEEMKTSRHSLVTNSDSSTPPRTMNVDYRLSDSNIPVNLPIIFVWVLAISLSIPEYTLASLIHQSHMICTIDSSHRFNMHSILVIFVLFIPLFILSSAISLIIIRLSSRKVLPVASRNILKLCLYLIITYVILCAPRSILSTYVTYSTSVHTLESVQNNVLLILNLTVSTSYLLSTLIRPIIYIVLVPQLRNAFMKTKEIEV